MVGDASADADAGGGRAASFLEPLPQRAGNPPNAIIPGREVVVVEEEEEEEEEEVEEKRYPEPCWLAGLARNDVLQYRGAEDVGLTERGTPKGPATVEAAAAAISTTSTLLTTLLLLLALLGWRWLRR